MYADYFTSCYAKCFSNCIHAQNAAVIIQELKSINKNISDKTCNQPTAAAISNRAMNIFMADKMGYLSHSNDLSYFTNYVTLNSLEGKFTVTHNFQQASGMDEPLKKIFNVGVNINIANSFAQSFLNNRYKNELGITLNFKW